MKVEQIYTGCLSQGAYYIESNGEAAIIDPLRETEPYIRMAEADKAKALLSLDLLDNRAVGIGDHSTEDFYKNAEEALIKLVDADDRIAALEKYFPPTKEVI